MTEHDTDGAAHEGFVLRTGRGSLAERIDLSGDWDSPKVNEVIARDFGLLPAARRGR